jgi:glycosyltransferase involved in cell wall biosynthesis
MGLEKLLKKKGHEVAVFSMQHPANLNSKYSKYFPGEVDFNKITLKNFFSVFVRPFGSPSVRRNFKRLVNDFKPDILHVNNIHSQLSPIIAKIAYKRKIPVVWTLHDYKLVCPAYLFISNAKICEACLTNKWSVIRKRCIKQSWLASIMAFCEFRFWNFKKLSKITNMFISPSSFLKGKMMMGGFESAKIQVISNFVNEEKFFPSEQIRENYYCYVGRLSFEKGIETLLKAATELPQYTLKLIGTGPIEKDLKSRYTSSNIEFLGYKNWSDLKRLIEGSRFLVMPSTWYENNPLSVIESLCLGTPVIGANIGGIPELIDNEINGLLFESGNITDLQNKISYLWENSANYNSSSIANVARIKFNSESYYEKLLKIYIDALNQTV